MINKFVIYIIAAGVIGAGGWYILSKDVDTPSEPQAVVQQEEQAADKESASDKSFSGEGALRSLFSAGDSFYCTFTSNITDAPSSGEFWYDNERYRVEAESMVSGLSYDTSVISDGEFMYIWSETDTEQMAIKMSVEATADNTDESATEKPFDIDENVQYDCNAWKATASTFVPPASVEFVDMNDFMNGAMQGMMQNLPEGMSY